VGDGDTSEADGVVNAVGRAGGTNPDLVSGSGGVDSIGDGNCAGCADGPAEDSTNDSTSRVEGGSAFGGANGADKASGAARDVGWRGPLSIGIGTRLQLAPCIPVSTSILSLSVPSITETSRPSCSRV
jgi:hypothetical protein